MSLARSAPWAVLLVCLLTAASASRLNLAEVHRQNLESEHREAARAPDADEKTCCCKEEVCTEEDEAEAKATAEGLPVYSPAHGLCCRFLSRCHFWWGFTTSAKSKDFCMAAQDTSFNDPEWPQQIPSALMPDGSTAADWKPKPNTAAHTVDSYCDMHGHSGVDAQDTERTVDSEDAAAGDSKKRRNAVIHELVKELARNSLDSMAKEIFSIYVCVRWAPNQEFHRLATDEIETEQLPTDADPYDLYAESNFIPMRCSRNVNVYDAGRSNNDTHFKYFEKALLAISEWLDAEQGGEVRRRLVAADETDREKLGEASSVFDLMQVAKTVAKCPPVKAKGPGRLHVRTASAKELLADCSTARWWLGKLRDWHTAFPFSSFMSPSKAAAVHAPKKHEQVLVCFGKRVASQLHRRAGGAHLLTDQSAVGCHGFWSFKQSAQMLRRTVMLWRPPTCQLAAMELDMKLKLMDAIADMNSQLFDALPAMMLDEVGQQPKDDDGAVLKPAGTMSTLGNVAGGVANALGWAFGLNKAYQRMGMLLGNTVVKWAVCPLRPLADHHEEGLLDGALGTEDDVARFYAQQAYSKWTGEEQPLPGEKCEKVEGSPTQQTVPRCSQCDLGIMQESMPEPYHDEDFACPVRPLLPAKQQLKVFEEKRDTCFLRMTVAQWREEEWMYRGHTPHRKQYNLTENRPSIGYQSVKVRSWRRAPDSKFGIWRDFVTVARRCTEEEYAATPRWCEEPKVGGGRSWGTAMNVLQGIGNGALTGATGVATVVHAGLQVSGHARETAPWNKAIGKRMTNWVYGVVKNAEGGIQGLWSSLLGRAKKRQDRLYNDLFSEVEAGELLHSASFQKELKNTGADSKGRKRYDRYAITCPCPNFDPDREFRLRYTWSERALLLGVAAEKSSPARDLYDNAVFSVELLGAGILHMEDNENAWQDSFSLLRAGGLGQKLPAWQDSRDPLISNIIGIDKARLYQASIFGLRATYACGTRKEMHDLPLDLTPEKAPGVPFAKCVWNGARRNQELRERSPNALFLAEETVVRVTFAPLEACYHEHFAKPTPEAPTGQAKEGAPEQVFGEADNALYKTFSGLGYGCEKPSSGIKKSLPEALTKGLGKSTYRGLFLAKGLPEDTLLEVLLDPADIVDERNNA